MKYQLALAFGLGFALSFPASAETYTNPDNAWWASFFMAVDGNVPDYERIAKADPAYLSADEFSRSAVLADLVARLEAEQARFDVGAAQVVVGIRAQLGDYSAEHSGFPINIFAQNMRLQPDHRDLFFRNWQQFSVYEATIDEGRALREKIGTQPLSVEVTLGDIRPSATRSRAYDARIVKVVYYAADGLKVAEIEAPEEKVVSGADADTQVAAMRGKISDLVGIPPLGSDWTTVKSQLPGAWPISASDDFFYGDLGKMLAWEHAEGVVVADESHDPGQIFHVYLQQVDGAWRTQRGVSGSALFDAAGTLDNVSTRGTGPGLACYTPEVLDRCVVLEFSPADGDHILTRAYGVIELPRADGDTVEGLFKAFVGEAAGVFDGFSAPLGYDAATLKTGVVPNFPAGRGVQSYAAGAGKLRDGEPIYDPLKNTTGVNTINREIAIFAVDGADSRIPLIFVLQ